MGGHDCGGDLERIGSPKAVCPKQPDGDLTRSCGRLDFMAGKGQGVQSREGLPHRRGIDGGVTLEARQCRDAFDLGRPPDDKLRISDSGSRTNSATNARVDDSATSSGMIAELSQNLIDR